MSFCCHSPMSSSTCGPLSAFHNHSTMVKLSPTKMGRAENMRRSGMSLRKIGAELKVSYEAVRLRLLAASQRGDLYPCSPPGRPPSPPRDMRRVHRELVNNPWLAYWQIARSLGVGIRLVRKVAHTSFLYRFLSKKKPLLTPKARRARCRWVTEVKDIDWTSIIWTDECMVRIGDRGRR